MKEIIDAHSHFGMNILHTGDVSKIEYFPCPWDEYKTHVKPLRITKTVASWAPCPEYSESGFTIRPCFWLYEDGTVNHYRETVSADGTIRREQARTNPYLEANHQLLNLIDTVSSQSDGVTLYGLLLHHPILDTQETFSQLLSDPRFVGVKLHGLATHTGPDDVPVFVPNALRKFNKPIIVHTDYARTKSGSVMQRLFDANDPLLWIQWAVKNQVKIFITHVARLCSKSIELAKQYPDQILIGIAPDLLLRDEQERLKVDSDDVLKDIFYLTEGNQLAFDVDLAWNIKARGNWFDKDWQFVERVNEFVRDETIRRRIYHDNASKFYNI